MQALNGLNEHAPTPRKHPHGAATLVAVALALLFAFGGLLSLGIWQLQRLGWKLDLIERVESRAHAAPSPLMAPDEWPAVTAERDEYRRVRLQGRYLPAADTRVQALTRLGAGFWILSPFELETGGVVLVNRGFVPHGTDAAPPPAEAVEVVGLLRMPERGGGFLRANDAAADRWHSRDVAAIAAARGLGPVAPFFVDAEADPAVAEGWPRGGLTVLHFNNHHLGYALTWFALALLVAWGGWRVFKEERKLRAGR